MRYTKEFQRIVQWMFMHKSPSAHDPWKEQDSVFLKRYSNRFICLQLSTISLKQVIRTCMRRSAHLWSDSNFLGWGCETGGCTLPETGGCTLLVAEDALRYCNFKSLSSIFSNHLIFTASASSESSGSRAVFFLIFREIRKKRSHWLGGQSAPRLYNRYNLCPCAKPAHVGAWECRPGPSSCSPKQCKSYGRLKIYNSNGARSPLTKSKKKKIIESAAM